MPTALTHAAAGVTAAYVLSGRRDSSMLWVYVILLSVMADFDVIGLTCGIPYAHTFGHRGFFHSLLFACLISAFFSTVYIAGRNGRVFVCSYFRILLVFILVSSLHPLLDMFTSGGLGIGLFIPFSNERLFFPDRPIRVSPIGISKFFSGRGLVVLKSEFRFVVIPSLIIFFTVFLFRRITIKPE